MKGLIVSLALFASAVLADVPTAKCPFDEQFDLCFKDFITKTIPVLGSHGVPEVGIPPLDPLKVPDLKASFNSVIAKGGIEVMDTVIKGLVISQILEFKTNIKEFNLQNFVIAQISVQVPRVTVEGNWKGGSLRAMDLNLAESGNFHLAVDNVKVTLLAEGNLQKHNESYYFPVVTKIKANKPEIGNVKIETSDLIKGDSQKSKSLLSLANSFWRILFDEVHPIVTQHIESLSFQFINSYIKEYLPLKAAEIEKMLHKNTNGK